MKTTATVTHDALVLHAARYLKQVAGCSIVATELYTSAPCIPDAIGWRCGRHSTLIECKTSRGDFLRDRKKWHRRLEGYQCGNYRFFLTPPGLLEPTEVPDDWGLLECDGRITSVVKVATFHADPPRTVEMIILCSLIRRARLRKAVPA
ncbi:MAG TPA: hypothetical protein VGN72_05005 [Tepidisphaeraceae bacterium]|jgi:hypothetical protein|nr:hypothetical protein [Tepidisphaeraceae bacterium]